MDGFEIRKAQHGGYTVQESSCSKDPGSYRGILFAGDLDACLDFIQRQFEPTKEGEAQ